MARLTKNDWLEKGLEVLATKGYINLRIEYLCDALTVSKGSFYHHFVNIDDYISNLIKKWESESEAVMDKTKEKGEDTLQMLNKLQDAVFGISPKLQVVIRAWATFNETVREHVESLDGKRLNFLIHLYVKEGYPKKQAHTIASLEYAMYIGMQNLYMEQTARKISNKFRVFEKVLLGYGKENIKSTI